MATSKPHPTEVDCTRYAQIIPNIWKIAAEVRGERWRWPPYCYVPLSVFANHPNVVETLAGNARATREWGRFGPVRLGAEVCALAAWRATKVVYRFDSELAAALVATRVSGDLPVELLRRLPQWCVYVDCPIGETFVGFYAHLDDSSGAGDVRFLLRDHVGYFLPLHLDAGKSIDENILDIHSRAIGRIFNAPAGGMPGALTDIRQRLTPESMRREAETLLPIVHAAVSMLLYLCSEAPDYSGREPPPHPMHRPRPRKEVAPHTTTVVDVGYRIGAALRLAREQHERGTSTTSGAGGERAPMVPHVRRAHWHLFWTGPRDGARTPRVRWLAPTLVNAREGATLATTEHKVEP